MQLKTIKAAVAICLCLSLCACGTEPEDRSFVTAIGITSDGVCMLTAQGNISDTDDNQKNKGVIYSDGSNIYSAVRECGNKVSGELFFGHTVVCVIGTDLLADRAKLRQAVDFLQADTQISRRVLLLAADDPVTVLSATTNELDTADFIGTYYKTHTAFRGTELDALCRALAESGDLLLPRVTADKDGILIDGGFMLTDGVLHTELTENDMYNISWLVDDNAKPQITITTKADTLDVTVLNKRTKVKTDGENASFDIHLKVKTDTDNTEQIATLTANQIKKAAETGAEFLLDNNCDVVGLQHAAEIKGVGHLSEEDVRGMIARVDVTVDVE
jgi:hypothetical protein